MNLIQQAFLHTATDLPPELWWLPVLVILVLGLAALIDMFTSVIPDSLIFFGTFVVTATQGVYVSWVFAAHHLTIALVAVFGLWAFNQIWCRLFKCDAIGMGDAKWTMLAVACFGAIPALFAWGLGACLAIVWMGMVRFFAAMVLRLPAGAQPRLSQARGQISRVYFAPFLFVGLLAGLYWLKLKS